MRAIYLFVPILLILQSSCKPEQKNQQQHIATLEKNLEESTDPQKAEAIIDQYQQYVENFPRDHEMNSKYLYRAAAWAYRLNHFSQAIDLLNRAIKNHYPGSNTVNNALFLGAIYREKLQNEFLSRTVYQAAHKAFPQSEDLAEKVSPEWPPLDERMQRIQQSVFDESGGRIDYRGANDFINAVTIYAMLLPREPRSAEWLFEAAETARTIRAFGKALNLYDWISRRFPGSDQAAQALFLQGFTLDSDLKRFDEAGVYYQQFLDRYPDNIFAKDARFLLENLGKDEEEIIRSFEEQNQPEQ